MSNIDEATFREKFNEGDRGKYEKAVRTLVMSGNDDWFLLADIKGESFVNHAVHCRNPDADIGVFNDALERKIQ